ncbi:MAG: TldD/PmbA family protein [Geminicoccaceae bacterium]
MDHDDLLDQVLALARGAGADAADCLIAERTSLDLTWRLGALEGLEREEAREIGLRVFVGRRVATATTTRIDPATLRSLVEDTVSAARLLPEDAWAGLAEPGQLASSPPELDLADPAEPTVAELERVAAEAEDAARSVAGITNSDGATAAWSARRLAIGASNGFRGRLVRTRHSLAVNVLAGSGTGMQDGDAYRHTTHRADLAPPATIGREAGERAAARLGPRKIATARVPVVYEPRTAASLLRHLAVAISGNAVASGRSFLKGQLGQPVFGPGITIGDDPLRRRGLGSRPFDSEGIATASRRLIDGGVLTTWLLDLGSGRRLGMASTGHASRDGAALGAPSASNLTLAPGEMSKEELIADIAQGFYVTDIMGMGANLVTGDYSRGASGFWIENGEITYPVGEVTIAGNLVEMFRQLTPASDLEIRGSIDAPTVRIDGMTVAGT